MGWSNISGVNLIHGNCMDFMASMPDKCFELAIVDPPYGTFSDNNAIERTGGSWSIKYQQNKTIKQWDFKPDNLYFKQLFRISVDQIIWGANYFTEFLPNNRCFVIWEKQTISEAFSMAMVEYAWCSFNLNAKLFKYRPQNGNRIHPTQKPVALYEWLLSNYAKPGDKILDTHAGSFSSAIACHNLGFDYVGIEKDKEYFEAGKRRVEMHQRQGRLF